MTKESPRTATRPVQQNKINQWIKGKRTGADSGQGIIFSWRCRNIMIIRLKLFVSWIFNFFQLCYTWSFVDYTGVPKTVAAEKSTFWPWLLLTFSTSWCGVFRQLQGCLSAEPCVPSGPWTSFSHPGSSLLFLSAPKWLDHEEGRTCKQGRSLGAWMTVRRQPIPKPYWLHAVTETNLGESSHWKVWGYLLQHRAYLTITAGSKQKS